MSDCKSDTTIGGQNIREDSKLNNAASGLYLQSPAYIYDYLVEEME
ncbi:MAG: hypothetical protein MJZ99_05705 [Bacteroidales bacterium]|nr:hypothetical protein [Candidatus Colimorpha merdihippi]MCQ2282099.1 hypothetical protein [Bacteroidales bacterium]